MRAYYNDNDPYCAQWLRNLIAAGYLPSGDVDDRSILKVEPDDLGFQQAHFFAGIGGWPLALALAGWPDDRPLWTGSCPCQPFSSAGKQSGSADERHLWPAWFRLIRKCRPDTIFGEQVEGAVGFGWIDRVFADLEAEGYACGAAILGAHSVNAPHIRQRLFWVAALDAAEQSILFGGRERLSDFVSMEMEAEQQGLCLPQYSTRKASPAPLLDAGATGGNRRSHQSEPFGQSPPKSPHRQHVGEQPQPRSFQRWRDKTEGPQQMASDPLDRGEVPMARLLRHEGGSGCGASEEIDGTRVGDHSNGAAGGVVYSSVSRERAYDGQSRESGKPQIAAGGSGLFGGLGDADAARSQRWRGHSRECADQRTARAAGEPFWSDAVWLPCLDGKARRVEPSIQPLAHAGEWGTGSRVGILRGAGNAIVPPLAAEFVKACLDAVRLLNPTD